MSELCDDPRTTRNQQQQYDSRSSWTPPALLPIPERSDGNTDRFCKSGLGFATARRTPDRGNINVSHNTS
jgi:hypothetical protein